ncbi:MAG: hypothetical protein MUF30_11945, partial [Burkholderiales bacterium]|nr:hypothetical protein [Burkholderiales bacterium]
MAADAPLSTFSGRVRRPLLPWLEAIAARGGLPVTLALNALVFAAYGAVNHLMDPLFDIDVLESAVLWPGAGIALFVVFT